MTWTDLAMSLAVPLGAAIIVLVIVTLQDRHAERTPH